MTSTTILLLSQDLERDEGRKSKPYKDSVGVLTIGVGHNLEAEGLCEEAINAQLEFDIRTKVTEPLRRYCPWSKDLPEAAQRGLGNLCFNLGINGLLKFKITLGHLEAGRFAAAADSLISNERYHKQVGQRLDRVAELFRASAT